MAGSINWFPLERIDELERAIMDRLDARRRTVRRDALACCFGLCGLRSGEVSQMELADLAVPLRRLTVRTIKGGPERVLSMSQSMVDALMDYRYGRQLRLSFDRPRPADLLLPNCRGRQTRRDQFNQMATRLFDAVLKSQAHGLTFHSLRHTFAMRVYAETRDLFLVQQLLGHASVSTTEIYARSLADLPDSCQVRLDHGTPRRPVPPGGGATICGVDVIPFSPRVGA